MTRPELSDVLDRLHVVALPMRVRFRGITTREAKRGTKHQGYLLGNGLWGHPCSTSGMYHTCRDRMYRSCRDGARCSISSLGFGKRQL